ncbi:unnamed protein product [Closterium sp. NIES-64]|nr:unnamed protein product [Closterium sp. NIES-64]
MVGSLPASLGNLTRLTAILFDPLSKTLGPRCGKEGACVVNQTAFTAFCNACPDFCLTCSPPGLCTGCKARATRRNQQQRQQQQQRQRRIVDGGNNWHRVWGGGAAARTAARCPLLSLPEEEEGLSLREMATKHHPNLVRLLGYATCGDLRERIEQILVYEFIPNGDLDKWLGKDAPAPLTLKQRLDVIVREKLGQGSLEEIADPRMGPVPPDALQRMADLAVRCCGTFTAERPSMGRIAQEMEALRTEVGGGEEPVHNKSYMKVDAELREKMLYQSQISEDNLNDALASIPSERVAQGTWGV